MSQTMQVLQSGNTPATHNPDGDFRNISNAVYDKTISFDEAIERLTKGRAETEDVQLPLDAVTFEQDKSTLLVNLDGNKVKPTKWALTQISNKLGVPAKIVTSLAEGDEEDVEVVTKILTNGKRHVLEEDKPVEGEEGEEEPKDKWLFRTRKDNSLRAALSSRYLKLDNLFFLESLKNILPQGRILGYNKCDGSDTVYGNILIPDSLRAEKDSNYGGGSFFANSEIGVKSAQLSPFLYRSICTNSMIMGKVKGVAFARKHLGTKIDHDKLFQNLVDCVNKQIPLVSDHIDTMLNTRSLLWSDSSKKLLAQAVIDLGLTKKQGAMLLEAYEVEPELSCFGLINAITRASQKMPSETWASCNEYGGLLTTESIWNIYRNKASVLTAKDVESCYAAVA